MADRPLNVIGSDTGVSPPVGDIRAAAGEPVQTRRGQAAWVTVVPLAAGPPIPVERPLSLRRVLLQMTGAAVLVAVVVGVGGSAVSRSLAENQAVHEVAETTDILAESVVQPALTDRITTDPRAAVAVGDLVRPRVLSSSLVRIKLWSPDGVIIYSDEARLIGQNFGLDSGARKALSAPQTRAEVTDLTRAENTYERSQGKLLEVYRPVWTPGGHELLFETYFRYDVVTERSTQLWRGFIGIIVSSMAVVFALLVPIMWTLLRRARRAQNQREAMMQRSLDASQEERQRIAADLHDGIVQELTATSFAVAAAAEAAAARGQSDLAAQLREAAGTVRTSMGGLRSLVVDIYPPTLRSAGLVAAMSDMAATVAGRGPRVTLDLDHGAADRTTSVQQEALFRVAQECLRNTVKHAVATEAVIRIAADETGATLTVSDDGVGFDPLARPARHLGISLMAAVAADIGAQLDLRTGPGMGTTWKMRVLTA